MRLNWMVKCSFCKVRVNPFVNSATYANGEKQPVESHDHLRAAIVANAMLHTECPTCGEKIDIGLKD